MDNLEEKLAQAYDRIHDLEEMITNLEESKSDLIDCIADIQKLTTKYY